jgi:hypothetical protein
MYYNRIWLERLKETTKIKLDSGHVVPRHRLNMELTEHKAEVLTHSYLMFSYCMWTERKMLQAINHLAIHPGEFYLLGYNAMPSIEVN